MLSKLLDYFPANTHPLALVNDPDSLLADEVALSTLIQRGYRIIQESDPVLFRNHIEQIKPFDASMPVLVITAGALEELPYDIWQQGVHIQLALHEFFPNLAYPILRTLTSLQRAHLWQIEGPKERMGEQRTIEFLLEQVFHFNTNLLVQPAHFVLWLEEYHASLAPFPPVILEFVLGQFHYLENYQGWDVKALLQDRETFRQFIQDQWQGFLSMQTGKVIREKSSAYLLHFEADQELQDALPRFLRNGSLTPITMETQAPMPAWIVPGILMLDEDPRPRRANELLAQLRETFSTMKAVSRWEEWKVVAYQWAELTKLRNEFNVPASEEKDKYKELQTRLDVIFTDWLTQKYSSLATQRLPIPHHVHHIPHYLSYLKSQGSVRRVALLVMDGMSLTDWLLIKEAWQSRQSNWQMKENLVLAQIPSITAISRHALISGMRPDDFYAPNSNKGTEAKAWTSFWTREGSPENASDYIALKLEKDDPTPEITNPRLQALCLIERQLDEIMHGSLLGAMDHQSTVKLWLSQNSTGINSSKLEKIINLLLEESFTVFIASDHGHCEAYGIGQPSQGIVARSRGKRVRVYTDHYAAEQAQTAFNQTILWKDDGLLPKDISALIPLGRQAFAEVDEIAITHGGITMDEIVVPLIEINKK
jgi:hypothetical protein